MTPRTARGRHTGGRYAFAPPRATVLLRPLQLKVLSAGADEVPGVFKNIEDVMREQADLVEIVARFDPKIVKMCDDGSQAED